MKLLTFEVRKQDHLGVVVKEGIADLTALAGVLPDQVPPKYFSSMDHFLKGGEKAIQTLEKLVGKLLPSKTSKDKLTVGRTRILYREKGIKIKPPVVTPSKIICLAMNYFSHSSERSAELPKYPYYFTKPLDTLVGHGDPIIIPRISKKPDHEVELAVVIGKEGKHIPSSKAYDYVAGYTILNDISFRDLQTPDRVGPRYGPHWFMGKGLDNASPVGPYLTLKDEVSNPYPLRLTLKVNGEVRQDGTTEDMVFKIPQLIEDLSTGVTLKPGDIIATGTCAGVGGATGLFLRPGDIVEAEIERLGILRNPVVEDRL